MKKAKLAIGVLTVLIASAFSLLESVNWKLKEDAYAVNFSGGKVKGILKGLKTTILFDEASPEKSKISATLEVNTINTGNGMMNKHALSETALDAEKFPAITFESATVSKKGTGYEAIGKLTIKGVSKEVVVPFTFENKGKEGVFKGKFTIVPKDYAITRGGTPDVLEIELTVPVNK